MACSGVFCSGNCLVVGPAGCSVYAPACPTNGTTWTDDPLVVDTTKIRAVHVNEMRASINNERTTRWATTAISGSDVVAETDLIKGSDYDNIKNGINGLVPGTITDSYTTNTKIPTSHTTNLRSAINTIRTNCVCDALCDLYSACACHNDCGCFYSDERLKENVKTVKQGLHHVDAMRPVAFTYKDDDKEHLGFIAQELEDLVPEVVEEDEQGFKRVRYAELIPVLVNAVKELSMRVKELEEKNAS